MQKCKILENEHQITYVKQRMNVSLAHLPWLVHPLGLHVTARVVVAEQDLGVLVGPAGKVDEAAPDLPEAKRGQQCSILNCPFETVITDFVPDHSSWVRCLVSPLVPDVDQGLTFLGFMFLI